MHTSGWFLQVVALAGSGMSDVWEVERLSVCRGVKLRPTIMHFNSKCKADGGVDAGKRDTGENEDSTRDRDVRGKGMKDNDTDDEGDSKDEGEEEGEGDGDSSYSSFLKSKRRRLEEKTTQSDASTSRPSRGTGSSAIVDRALGCEGGE
jgi:hypothetical protein